MMRGIQSLSGILHALDSQHLAYQERAVFAGDVSGMVEPFGIEKGILSVLSDMQGHVENQIMIK